MSFVLVKNNKAVEYPYSITTFKENNPTVSLPLEPTEEQLNEQCIFSVIPKNKPTWNPITENCVEVLPVLNDGIWEQTWLISEATPQEIEYRETNIRSENAAEAARLLQESDWTEVPSVVDTNTKPYLENSAEWVEYRTALRIIAIQRPLSVDVWPSKPSEQWSV